MSDRTQNEVFFFLGLFFERKIGEGPGSSVMSNKELSFKVVLLGEGRRARGGE